MARPVLILWAALLSLALGGAEEAPRLLFYAPLDGSLIPQVAAPGTSPAASGKAAYAPGVKGLALHVPADQVFSAAYQLAGNLDLDQGTITFWYRPEWNEKHSHGRSPVCPLFAAATARTKLGDGSISIFAWGTNVRGDLSCDPTFKKCLNLLENGRWSHVAFTWRGYRSTLYVDGVPSLYGPSHGAHRVILHPDPKWAVVHPKYPELRRRITDFCIGASAGNHSSSSGLIDELKIYSAPLTAEDVAAEAGALSPLYASRLFDRYVIGGRSGETLRGELVNSGTVPCRVSWRFTDAEGKVIAASSGAVSAAPGQRRSFTAELEAAAAGQGQFTVTDADSGRELLRREFFALTPANPRLSTQRHTLKLKTLFKLEPHKMVNDPANFAVKGETRTGSLDGRPYLEAGRRRCDRFALRLHLPEPRKLYLIELDYPDDAKRTADVILQPSGSNAPAFEMQTGYLAGDDLVNTGRMLTSARVYYASATDLALIVMTARPEAPAALAEVRVSLIEDGKLCDPMISDAAPVDGQRRMVAMNFEDPSITGSFNYPCFSPEGGIAMIDHFSAYLRYSGLNALVYPAYFYGAPINNEYTDRAHAPEFLQLWCKRFETDGIAFYPALNLYGIPGQELRPPASVLGKGYYNDSCFSVLGTTGDPCITGLHRSPPLFNFMHPDTRAYVKSAMDDVLFRIGSSPAFKGVVFNMSPRSFLSFGMAEAGYNDYTLAFFERETGIGVPVDRKDPLRGKLAYQWLREHAWEDWLNWRCRKLTEFYRECADYLRSRRPDAVLVVNPRFDYSRFNHLPEFQDRDYADRKLREAGIDPGSLAKVPGLVYMHTGFPAAYRHRDGLDASTAAGVRRLREIELEPEYYRGLVAVPRGIMHLHDQYWESQVGNPHPKNDPKEKDPGDPLVSPWLKETIWRVSVLNNAGVGNVRPYVFPLRYTDLIGISRGGFLVGSYGTEKETVALARVFRALPAAKFADAGKPQPGVKVRELKLDGAWWRYVVNTTPYSATVKLEFPGSAVTVPEGKAVPAGPLELTLEPYALAAFRSAAK